jgi:hypothetical protein
LIISVKAVGNGSSPIVFVSKEISLLEAPQIFELSNMEQQEITVVHTLSSNL